MGGRACRYPDMPDTAPHEAPSPQPPGGAEPPDGRLGAAIDGLGILAWQADDAAVVFDEATGRTHKLPLAAARVLCALRRGAGPEPAEADPAHLALLEHLGLVDTRRMRSAIAPA